MSLAAIIVIMLTDSWQIPWGHKMFYKSRTSGLCGLTQWPIHLCHRKQSLPLDNNSSLSAYSGGSLFLSDTSLQHPWVLWWELHWNRLLLPGRICLQVPFIKYFGYWQKTLYTIHQCASDWSETFSLFLFWWVLTESVCLTELLCEYKREN